jgi:hypothetical protein
MNKGDEQNVRRGPLSGMLVRLDRHDSANLAWYCTVLMDKQNVKDGQKVLIYEYELAETIERKGKGKVKRGN